ncbi:MAG: aminotransferase [Rhodospirillaceae bacterium]|jgi:N-succinyldiaminopimelate aminotransferase|nr:aminotransferase [Rhodospirillaceae bacterium]MBT6116384.1 aminotransferase [Rhodospirillaceae bacterium]
MKPANSVVMGNPASVFAEMSRLAVEHNAVNLGQGFPDGDGDEDVRRVAIEATEKGANQYPRSLGVPELCQAMAEHDRRFYGAEYDWQSEVLITCGATEALAVAIFGLIEPGDEVVMIEPVFNIYVPMVRRAGGVPKYVQLQPPGWELDHAALEAAFSPRTKMILLNTPMNPTGKIFGQKDLEKIAELCLRYDAYALSDEVYEHHTFDGRKHIPLSTLPGMAERTVRVGSAGKIFSVTGWKVGFMAAKAETLVPAIKMHQYMIFSTPGNLQLGIAHGMGKPDEYFHALGADLQAKRDRFAGALNRMGMETLPCEATIFLSADIRSVGFNGTDVEFCRHIAEEAGVAAIPYSALYESGKAPDHYVRFSFCKYDESLDEAADRLARHFARS